MAQAPRKVRPSAVRGSALYALVDEFNKIVNWLEQHVHVTAMTNPPSVLTSAFGINRVVGLDGKLPNNAAPSAGNVVRVASFGLVGSLEYELAILLSGILNSLDIHTHSAINAPPNAGLVVTGSNTLADANGREPGSGVLVNSFYGSGGFKSVSMTDMSPLATEFNDAMALVQEWNAMLPAYNAHQHAAVGGVSAAAWWVTVARIASIEGRDQAGAVVL
jgi:hypothetical protein